MGNPADRARAIVARWAVAEDMAAALEAAALDLHGYHGAQQPYAECEWGGCVENRAVLAAWEASGAAPESTERPQGGAQGAGGDHA